MSDEAVRMCVNCGERIRPIAETDGLDLRNYGHEWTHADGSPLCGNGWYDEATEKWVEPTYASDGQDGWGR